MELSVKERDYLNNLINLFNIEPEYIEKIIYYDVDLGCEVGYIEAVYPIMDKELTNRYLSTTSKDAFFTSSLVFSPSIIIIRLGNFFCTSKYA